LTKARALDDVRLANYFAGIELEPGPIEAWRVDNDVAITLGVPVGTKVWLSNYNLTKIGFQHPEIIFSDYRRLPSIFASGFVVRGDTRTAEIFSIEEKPMKVVLKATKRDEVFVTTFHRIKWPEVRRLYRRARRKQSLIRDVNAELARLLLPRQL